MPLQIILGLLLLQSPEKGLLKAIAFVTGMTLTRMLQGLLFGWLLADAMTAGENGKNPILSILLLVLGILLLIAAYKKWQREEDPDDAPPKVFTLIDRLTPLKAFGLGFSFPLIAAKLWVFTLSALTTIAAAQLEFGASAVAYLLFIVLAESLLLLPILARILLPERSQSVLTQLSAGLTRHSRPITIAVSLVFGLFFLQSGISGLRA